MKDWVRKIKRLGACSESLEWAEQFDSLEEAWNKCERGDWMELAGERNLAEARSIQSPGQPP